MQVSSKINKEMESNFEIHDPEQERENNINFHDQKKFIVIQLQQSHACTLSGNHSCEIEL